MVVPSSLPDSDTVVCMYVCMYVCSMYGKNRRRGKEEKGSRVAEKRSSRCCLQMKMQKSDEISLTSLTVSPPHPFDGRRQSA